MGGRRGRSLSQHVRVGEPVLHPLHAPPVEGPHPHQVGAAAGQGTQADGDLITGPDQAQIAAHPGLIRDDEGVFGVRLALAPVGSQNAVHDQAGDVDHRLVVTEQQPDQQSSAAVVELDGPQHVGVEGQSVLDQFQQGRLVVQDPAGQQAFALWVNHNDNAVVMLLADVHSGSCLRHGHLRRATPAGRRRAASSGSGRGAARAVGGAPTG